MLGRALREAHATVPFRLVSLDGGKSRNAIPRDAHAVVAVAADRESRPPRARRVGRGDDPRRVREDRRRRDRHGRVGGRGRATRGREAGTATLLDAIALVPTGPLAMSPDFDGLVETSTSLGEAITEGDTLTLHSLTRSSNDSAMPEVIARARRGGARSPAASLEVKHNYGGWRPNLDSPALAAAQPRLRAARSASRRSSPRSTPGSRRP